MLHDADAACVATVYTCVYKSKKKKKMLLDQRMVQRAKHTCKKQVTSVSMSLIIKFFFNGPTFDVATPTIAKINTNTQKAVTFNDLKSYFMDMCTSWQADRKINEYCTILTTD